MTLTFYLAPILTPDYKDIITYMDDYLSELVDAGRSSEVEVEEFTPSLTGETIITLPPFINTINSLSHPSYVTFYTHLVNGGGGEAGPKFYGFVTECDTVTTNAVRITITCDFVATFMIPIRAVIRGVLTKSTVARDYNDGAYKFPGYYSIPADFSKQNGSVTRTPLRTVGGYRIVVTFQCYQNNTWPAADGKAFQVTGVTTNAFTATELRGGITAVNNFCAPVVFRVGATVYDVISISHIQFVPSWMLPITSYIPGYLSSSTETQGTYGGFLFGQNSRNIYGPFDFDITPTADFNRAKSRLFIGNRQIKIPVADRHTHSIDTMAWLSCYVALDGFHCTLETDGVTDLSNLFDAPYIYNSDSELAYSSGDARQLSLVSAGVSGVAGIVSGTALLASGNPLGLVGIAQSGVSVAQAVNSAQYRGRDVVSTGSASVASELDYGVIYFIRESPANGTARANDAALNGYACQIPVSDGSTLYGLMSRVSADDNTRYMMEAYVFAPGVRATPVGVSHGTPSVPGWALRAFEEILERGVRLWNIGQLSLSEMGNEAYIVNQRRNP